MSIINTQVQPFKAQAFHNGKFVEVTDQSIRGKWSVFVFMPAAFTFNCPTEVEDAAQNYAEFQKLESEVYIVTTDTHFAHKVWHETSPAVGKARFPLVGDPAHRLTRMFGVHIEEEGLALRGTFIVDPRGVVKTAEIHDNSIARDVKETLRKLKAAQHVARNPGQVCPARWNEGAPALTPSLDLVGKILGGMAVFGIDVIGNEPFAYQWLFNGTELPGETSAALTVTNVQFSSAGGYTVRVTNWVGSVLSELARLNVYPLGQGLRSIATPAAVDMVYDDARDLMYISSGNSILRYSLNSNLFLTPFQVGSALAGIDLSPDGNTLVVADHNGASTSSWIFIVDVRTGQTRQVLLPIWL